MEESNWSPEKTSPPLTSFVEASPAKTCLPRACAEDLLALARACGVSSLVSSPSSSLAGSSSKTSRVEPSSGSIPSCETWDSSAMKRYRSQFRRRALARLTDGSGSSSSPGVFPTSTLRDSERSVKGKARNSPALNHVAALFPTASAARYGSSNNGDPHDGRGEYATKGKPSLDSLARRWPTAVVQEAESAARHTTTTGQSHPGSTLIDALREWSTRLDRATWKDGESGFPAASHLPRLNHRFVEALMGFPRGWLRCSIRPGQLKLF